MANPKATGGTHELRETYATEIVELARLETNVYSDFSEDYDKDEVTGQIKVPTRDGDVTVSDYDVKNGVALTQSKTEYIDLPLDKAYAVNELIDGYEAEAVPDNLKAQRLESAGYALGTKQENDAIDCLVKKGTTSKNTTALTASTAYKTISDEIINMKKRGMKVAKMKVVISADVEALLLSDDKFANTASQLGAELVREGVIGKIGGVAVKPNYFLPANVEFIVYDTRYCQKAMIWKKDPSIEDIKDGKHIGASALQGRSVGGLMVTNALGVEVKTVATTPVTPPTTGGGTQGQSDNQTENSDNQPTE